MLRMATQETPTSMRTQNMCFSFLTNSILESMANSRGPRSRVDPSWLSDLRLTLVFRDEPPALDALEPKCATGSVEEEVIVRVLSWSREDEGDRLCLWEGWSRGRAKGE